MQEATSMSDQTLVIACGALAHEITALIKTNAWSHLKVQCLPADLHNTPQKIPEAVRQKIQLGREQFQHIFVAYADCGTGGLLDKVLLEEKVDRLPGAHCYATYAGQDDFEAMAEEELGTFYLTDFLARHFDRLIAHGMGLKKHPELMPMMFGNYKKLVYLAQRPTPELCARAEAAAQYLGLHYVYKETGYGELADGLRTTAEHTIQWQN